MSRRLAPTLALLGLGLAPLVACGDDNDAAAPDVLSIEMSDFSFGDLPDEVPAGVSIEVENVSDSELHEVVAIRLPDDDERPLGEIVSGDLGPLVSGGPPAAVVLAPPGGEQIVAVGDGTLAEPGRYLLICMIPTGADPTEYLEAAATSDGPPTVDGGPPHLAHGMFADVAVTG